MMARPGPLPDDLAAPALAPEAADTPAHPAHDGSGRARSYSWADPASAAAAALELSGADFFGKLTSGELPVPPIAETLGFTAAAVKDGVARFELDPGEFHYNPMGSVHGGVLATLCDSACGCAVHSLLPAGAYYTSLDLNVKFLRRVTASTGHLVCEGTVVHLGSRSALAQATLTGLDGRLYAHATSSCMIFR
jgi:uncharacterized protein (TIGR00369 family)